MASIARNSSIPRVSCSLQYLRHSQRRPFSVSRTQQASREAGQHDIHKNFPKHKSANSRMRTLKKSELPTDLGLLPQTYIRPCGNMPSWFSQPLIRAKLEWLYIKQGFIDFWGGVYTYRFNQGSDPLTGKRRKLPLGLRERYAVTRDLHKQLYTALASGDRATVNKIACSGLANQQIGRIDRARMNGVPPETWSVKYRGWTMPENLYFTIQALIPSFLKSVHVIADRRAQIPVGAGLLLRQVVLRVDSTQTLDKNDGSPAVTKNIREYVVIQKSVLKNDDSGEEDKWMIWGTVQPTDTASALEILETGKQEHGSLMDRMRSAMPGL